MTVRGEPWVLEARLRTLRSALESVGRSAIEASESTGRQACACNQAGSEAATMLESTLDRVRAGMQPGAALPAVLERHRSEWRLEEREWRLHLESRRQSLAAAIHAAAEEGRRLQDCAASMRAAIDAAAERIAQIASTEEHVHGTLDALQELGNQIERDTQAILRMRQELG